jgi:hypothetical protein
MEIAACVGKALGTCVPPERAVVRWQQHLEIHAAGVVDRQDDVGIDLVSKKNRRIDQAQSSSRAGGRHSREQRAEQAYA